MVKFVELPGENGQVLTINPDRVAYLRPPGLQVTDRTRVIFDGVAGGVHELTVHLPVEEVRYALETRKAPAPKTPEAT